MPTSWTSITLRQMCGRPEVNQKFEAFYIGDQSQISANMLPLPIKGASSLPYEDSFLMIGGYSQTLDEELNTVFRFDAEEESFVLMEGVSLRQERRFFSAMYVDAQSLPKCEEG